MKYEFGSLGELRGLLIFRVGVAYPQRSAAKSVQFPSFLVGTNAKVRDQTLSVLFSAAKCFTLVRK
jgi:hypothetical protein